MKKRSFFERLTGSTNMDEDEQDFGEIEEETPSRVSIRDEKIDRSGNGSDRGGNVMARIQQNHSSWMEEDAGEGELSIDVYQTPDDVIVRAMIPGVKREELDISISRDSITIKGARKEDRSIAEDDYVIRELYWGSFSRTVALPHEVDIEHAEAVESQGVLTIRLPRVDKEKQAKLKVRSV